ncbi:unnamed protein product [Ectocarpus sp. CCAP 1310/34]|nr:unnamed protein product [Ectocarpus sp. CCAP 1310/34]
MISRRVIAAKPWQHHLGKGRACRSFAASGGGGDGTPAVKVFDRTAKRRQRDRAAAADWEGEFDYLREHIARVLVDRIEDISREFPRALDVGAHAGHIYNAICEKPGLNGKGGVGGVEHLTQCDISEKALLRGASSSRSRQEESRRGAAAGEEGSVEVDTCCVVADEEFLPFAPASFDLVLSNLALHWVNDLPGALGQIKQVLKPDGAFIGAMLGGSTLTELRSCLLLAEQEREGGQSIHTSPSAHVADCGSLLQSAGFSLPTVDQDTVRVGYPNAFVLMEHLQGMGESNAAMNTRPRVSRETMLAAAAAYQELYGEDDGTVQATFQVVYMIGWAPHESQPQPKRRGSGQARIGDVTVTQSKPPEI